MNKAKTKLKIIPILSAVLGVVFAFTIGFVYASSVINFNYGTNSKSTTAYFANQQYVVINDTTKSPITYSVGSHSTEVALQYAIDYNFDVRVKYSLSWSDENLATDNVNLIFANRDNIIVDESYIYFIKYTNNVPTGLTAGEGKLSIIAGVEFIETNNADYIGETLTISIDEVLVEKQSASYSTSHALYNSGEAGKAWLKHKQTAANQTDAYVMVYNFRHNKDTGVSYPGHNSAYNKVTDNGVFSASWLGGNRAFAGVGVYIITTSKPVTLTSSVAGTWRKTTQEAQVLDTSTDAVQYDNNIRFNYSTGWSGTTYDTNYLFETKTYSKVIPANSACYIEIVDSVEITSAGYISTNNYDDYRLIINNITINEQTFAYNDDNTSSRITSATIAGMTTSGTNYSQQAVDVVKQTSYANNLFDISDVNEQTFDKSSLALVNNTDQEQVVTLTYKLTYYVSNGNQSLTYETTEDGVEILHRATQFTDNAYYRAEETLTGSTYFTAPTNVEYILAPYSCVDINSSFSVLAGFVTYVSNKYGGLYDVWVELNPTTSVTASAGSENLAIEVCSSGTSGTVKIKNNSNIVVNAFSGVVNISSYDLFINSTLASQPNDWMASFWKFYYIDATTKEYVQNESTTWKDSTFYSGTYITTPISLTAKTNVSYTSSSGAVTVSGLTLKPNESVDILTFTVPTGSEIILEGYVEVTSTTAANSLMLVNSNVQTNYIVNYSTNSYIIRVNGSIPTGESIPNAQYVNNYTYYTTVIRPGQIIKTTSTATTLNSVQITGGVYDSSKLTSAGWDSSIVTLFNNYFS